MFFFHFSRFAFSFAHYLIQFDIVVNRVACPTKLVEYMFYGITPIVLSKEIDDYNELGYEYLDYKDFKDFEYIVIDGATTDSSVDITKNYSHRINYWVSEKDNGIYHTMDKAVNRAVGKYCFFANSGDYFIDSKVLSSVASQLKENDVYYIGGDIYAEIKGKTVFSYSNPDKVDGHTLLYFWFAHQALFTNY